MRDCDGEPEGGGLLPPIEATDPLAKLAMVVRASPSPWMRVDSARMLIGQTPFPLAKLPKKPKRKKHDAG